MYAARFTDFDFEFDDAYFEQESASNPSNMRGQARPDAESPRPETELDVSDLFDQETLADGLTEHRLISGFLALVLYLGGGICVIGALLLLFEPVTLNTIFSTAATVPGVIASMFRDIGSVLTAG
jgi:hypothetical protein